MLIVCWRISKRFGEIYTNFHVTATKVAQTFPFLYVGAEGGGCVCGRSQVSGNMKCKQLLWEQHWGDHVRFVSPLSSLALTEISSRAKQRAQRGGGVQN